MDRSCLASLEKSLSTRTRLVIGILIVSAALIRVVYFLQINPGPCVLQHNRTQTDMNYFHLWASDIASGDLLSSKMPHAHHMWHTDFAELYFSAQPDPIQERARFQTSAKTPDPARALWDYWYGPMVFHQEPLYPYLIAMTYKIFGEDVRWVFFWQMIIGILSVLLVFKIALRHFGATVATLAASLAIFCGPSLYYEMILLRPTLITFFGLLLVELTDRSLEKETGRRWFWTGLVCGLAILLKTMFTLFLLGVLVFIIWDHRTSVKRLLLFTGALTLGVVISLSPAILRNMVLGVSPLSLSSVGAVTFINSNADDYSPEPGFSISRHATTIMGKSKGDFLPAAIMTLSTHSGPLSYLKLLLRKADMLLYWYEIPNNTNYYYYRLHAPILNFTFTFLILGPLSLLGLVFVFPDWKKQWPILLILVSNAAVMIGFYVLSRFRVSMMVALLPLAAFGAVRIACWLERREVKKTILSILALIVISFWTARPLPDNVTFIRAEDYWSAYSAFYIPKMQHFAQQNDWQKVVSLLKDSLRFEPPEVRRLDSYHRAEKPEQRELARLYGIIHKSYAEALLNQGLADLANQELQRGHELTQAAGDEI